MDRLAARSSKAFSIGSIPWLHKLKYVNSVSGESIVYSSATVILFSVSVPVLSEQMTVALPSVSTAGSRRIMAFRFAILSTPSDSMMVTSAGRLSGMAATPRLTEVINIEKIGCLWYIPMIKRPRQMRSATVPKTFPVWFSFFWRGVSGAVSSEIIPAICPSSVFIPVQVTIAFPWPEMTSVPENAMFFCSAIGTASALIGSTLFSIGWVSPVRVDSSIESPMQDAILTSAGTRFPASRIMTSPGTSRAESSCFISPSRMTRASGEERFFSASRDRLALASCTTPRMAFMTTIARIMAGSIKST